MSHIKLYAEGAFWYAGSGYEEELKDTVGHYCSILKDRKIHIDNRISTFLSGKKTFADSIYDAYLAIAEAANNGDIEAERTLKVMDDYMDFINRFPNYFRVEDDSQLNIALAERNDAYSQALLGDRFYYGNGVEQSYQKAAVWFEKAAQQGEPMSQYNLAGCYETGRGVNKNKEKALDWYRKAAMQGFREAKRAVRRIELLNRGFTGDITPYLPTYILDGEKDMGWTDEYGVMYSQDGKRLLDAPSDIKEYAIRKGTQVICDYAFGRTEISRISFPDSVLVIGDKAFKECQKLTSILLPPALREIGDCSFEYTGLRDIEIPNGVLVMGDGAFRECYRLESIRISSSVQEIGKELTVWCKHLKSIIVDPKNSVYDSRNDCNAVIETKKNALIAGCNTTIIPETVSVIGYGAFWGCDEMTSINIPNGVLTIGEHAFFKCVKLNSVVIGDSVTRIEDSAFEDCKHLVSVQFSKGLTEIGSYSFKYCFSLKNISFPNGLQSIGEEAFDRCDSIEAVVMPDSLTNIEDRAFIACERLRSVTLPNNIKKIGKEIFYGCGKLKAVNIPSSLKIMGTRAFSYCSSLETIVFPQNVALIEEEALANCKHLQSLTLLCPKTEVEESAFNDCKALSIIYIPSGSKVHYERMLHKHKKLLVELA